MFKLLKIASCLLTVITLQAQAIVNTESSIKSFNNDGLNGELNLELKGSSGNKKSSDLAVDAAVGWKTDNSKTLLLFGREFGKSNDITDTDSSFVYFKHLQSIQNNYQATFFAQSEQDHFKDIESRQIIGLGIRSDINEQNLFEISLMQEEIVSTVESEEDRSTTRLNIMWYLNYPFSQNITYKNTVYYQPSIESFSNKQAINQASLTIDINENFKVDIYHKLTHFSSPIGDSKSTDTVYGTKFNYKF